MLPLVLSLDTKKSLALLSLLSQPSIRYLWTPVRNFPLAAFSRVSSPSSLNLFFCDGWSSPLIVMVALH